MYLLILILLCDNDRLLGITGDGSRDSDRLRTHEKYQVWISLSDLRWAQKSNLLEKIMKIVIFLNQRNFAAIRSILVFGCSEQPFFLLDSQTASNIMLITTIGCYPEPSAVRAIC